MSGAQFATFAGDLLRASLGIESMAEAAEMRAARGALQTARAVAPVDSGETRNEIHIVKRRGGGLSVESSTEASPYQEYGTSIMPPNPFILPAVERWGPELVTDVEKIRDLVVKRLS
jgi:HK97 gp10 family phage protein